MRILLCLLSFFLCTTIAHGQFGNWGGGGGGSKIKGKITGTLIDSISGEQIGFATVVLKKAKKTSEINGVLTEDNGKFKLAELKMGKYDIYVSFLGYNDKVIRDIAVSYTHLPSPRDS